MCIYLKNDSSTQCTHAECKIVSTIKKMNENLFVGQHNMFNPEN